MAYFYFCFTIYSDRCLFEDYITPEAYSKPDQTSKTEYVVKMVHGLKPLTVSAIPSILDVVIGCKCAFVHCVSHSLKTQR